MSQVEKSGNGRDTESEIPKPKITATGSRRKAPKIAGSGSSIPTGNLLNFFLVDSSQFSVLSGRNRWEIIGKNPKIFR